MKSLCVIGSLNMDLVTTVENFPIAGQTVVGKEFNTFPGGKGANQAIALGRLGSDVLMVGKIGEDIYGRKYLEVLKNNNVNYDGVSIEKGMSSGVAVIQVSNNGENNIIVVPGANAEVDIKYIESQWSLIEKADIFLFQLEIPLETVIGTMKKLKKQGKTVILDPAPAVHLPDEIFKYVDYLTPNETELETLIGRKINNEEDLVEASQILFNKGVKVIVAKLGSDGAAIIKEDKCIRVSGFIVDAVDTTAAGDSFNAGFAFALAKEKELKECVRFGNAVGAISTTALGAQEAMPTFERVEEFIRGR
ncbi:ribokinase [Clostridium beijerinckii]|uniref:ribokinase n=1 Tax=Clostridium beijerinckii TaxID=1520 RepID=UPI00047E151D|nr:ribokinase [Clostridium beijerinckii]